MEKLDSTKNRDRSSWIRYYSSLLNAPPKEETGGSCMKAEGSNQSKKAGQKRKLEDDDLALTNPRSKLAKTEEVQKSLLEGKIGLEAKKPHVVEKVSSSTKTEGSLDQSMKSGQKLGNLTTATKACAKSTDQLKEMEKLLQEAKNDREEENPEILIDLPTKSQLQERMAAHLPQDKVTNLVKYIREEVNIRRMRLLKSGPAVLRRDVNGNHTVHHPWEGYGLKKEDYEKDMEWLKLIYKEDQSQEKLMKRWTWGREVWTQYAYVFFRNRSQFQNIRDGRMMELQAREAIVEYGLLKKK